MTTSMFAHSLDPRRPYKLARELARPVARGWLPEPVARAALTLAAVSAAPDHPGLDHYCTRLTATLRDAERSHAAALDKAERQVRYAVRPMCERRMPGAAIIAEAERIGGGVLRRHELVDICRTVAVQAQGGRHGGR